MEIVPWMMLSAAMRVFTVHHGLVQLAATAASDLFMFIAFLLGARRMIERTGGTTSLGTMRFRQQLRLAHKVLLPVVGLIIVSAAIVHSLGWRWTGLHMTIGFDGIAYDQGTIGGMVWSGFLAAVTLLLMLRVEFVGDANLLAALLEFCRRARHLVPAVAAIAAIDALFSLLQGEARQVVYAFWISNAAPSLVRALTFFAFVFAFASLRLWITLAILVFALRGSYKSQAPTARDLTPT